MLCVGYSLAQMRRARKKLVLFLILPITALMVLAATLPAVAQEGIATLAPKPTQEQTTAQPLPTYTPYPTATPYPTYTPYPEPTALAIAPPPQAPAPRLIPGLGEDAQRQADTQIHQVQLQLERLQADRIARGAPLLQLASTHERPPAELNPPDPARRVGIDSWYSSRVELPDRMGVSVAVHVYDGPRGRGYVLVCTMVRDRITWQREINIGPEAWREHDWTALP